MGLHHLTDDGYLHWHCPNPACRYHNCAAWHTDIQCADHQQKSTSGETRTVHLSHEQVQWAASDLVALPSCLCGSQTFVKTKFSDQELAPPVITRNEDGSIQSVQIVGALNFTIVEQEVRRHLLEDPNKPGEMIEAFSIHIKDVRQHPMIAHHQKLHRLLHEHGKPAPQKALPHA